MYNIEEISPAKYVKCQHFGTKLIDLIENTRMAPFDYDVEVLHQVYDLKDTGMKYALGDSLAIWPENDKDAAREFCQYLGFNPDQWIRIKKAGAEINPKLDTLFKKPLTIEQLFVECLDFNGKPNRAIYEMLYKYVTDEVEKESAKGILLKDNVETLKRWAKEET